MKGETRIAGVRLRIGDPAMNDHHILPSLLRGFRLALEALLHRLNHFTKPIEVQSGKHCVADEVSRKQPGWKWSRSTILPSEQHVV